MNSVESSPSGLVKYIKNTGWLFLEKALRIAVTFTVWAMVIRYLGPEQFGVFSYALSYVFLFGMLADLGMESVLVKDLVEKPQSHAMILGSAFVVRCIGVGIAFLLIGISLFWIQEFNTRMAVALVAIRLLFVPLTNIDSYFQSNILSKYTTFAQMIALAMTSMLCILFIVLHKSLFYFIWVVIFESAVSATVIVILYRKHCAKQWVLNQDIMSDLFKRSWPMLISAFAISIYMRLDQVMIKHMLGDAAVGQYAVAVRVSEAFYFIPMVIAASLFPAIIQAKGKGERIYYSRLKALSSLLIWISLAMAGIFSFGGDYLIRVVFGSAYSMSSSVLIIHIWASVFVFIGVLRSKWAVNEHAQGLVMIYTLLGALINVLLNLVWIPLWGIKGAAVATIVAQCFAATASNLLHPKTRPMFFLQLQALNPMCLLREKWQEQ